MPLITTMGVLSARALGFSGTAYVKPALLSTGPDPGTITSNSTGYAVSGFGNTTFAYLNAPKTSGKWYWEMKYLGSNYAWVGVADNVATAVDYGGYSTANAGLRTTTPVQWVDSAWTGGSVGTYTGSWPPTTNDIFSCALDMDSATKTFKVYQNNVLVLTISWTDGALTLWAHFPFQSSPSIQINLGPAGCTYPPPSGYLYI